MGKPDGIEPRDWHRATMAVVHAPEYTQRLHEDVARAIATARDEGRAEQREVAAHIVTNCPAWVVNTDEDAERTGMLGRQTTRADLAAAIRKGEP